MEHKEQLINRLDERIPHVDGIKKRKYVLLKSCLEDDDFLEFLENQEKQRLNNLANNLQHNNLEWVEQNQAGTIEDLTSILTKCIAFLNDKKKNIAYFEEKFNTLENNISEAQDNIQNINETAKLISGATVLAEYAKEFDKDASDHKNNAANWMKWLKYSVIGLFILITILLFVEITELPVIRDLLSSEIRQSGHAHLLALSIKAALLIAYLQIPYFIKRNFFAEKHLEQAYVHRRNVLKSLHAVYNTVENNIEKDRLITIGATIAFSESESGYITRKEGAGSDDFVESLLSRFWGGSK